MSADTKPGGGATEADARMGPLDGWLCQKALMVKKLEDQRNTARNPAKRQRLSDEIAGLSGVIDLASALPSTEVGRADLAMRSRETPQHPAKTT